MKNNAAEAGIQKGDKTQIHDHVIFPVSLRVINIISNAVTVILASIIFNYPMALVAQAYQGKPYCWLKQYGLPYIISCKI